MKHHHHKENAKTSDNHSHHDHHSHMIDDFKKRFWISLILTLPVLFLSPMIQEFLGFTFEFQGSEYVSLLLSSVIFFYGGWPFLIGFRDELKKGNPGMMTLIAIAISVAFIYSAAVVIGLEGKMFFWELATLVVIMLLGHWIEMKAVMGASKSLEMMVSMIPSEAHVVRVDQVMDIPVNQLEIGEKILIKPGEKIPADGTVSSGESYINESMLTGESQLVLKSKGDTIIAGSINGNGSLEATVEKTGESSYINSVIHLVKEAQKTKSRTQHLADKAAKWLAYIALISGTLTFIIWFLFEKDIAFALERMVTVMVISCPHALGLAIPLVVGISTAISAQNGFLIRNRTAFENTRKITSIIFDKTGTLTLGNFAVSRISSFNKDIEEVQILTWAAALEENSEHPIAKGILEKAASMDLDVPKAKDFSSITGKGIEATVDGKAIKIVSPGYLAENSISIPDREENNSIETIVYVMVDGQLLGAISLSDTLRPESKLAIDKFKKEGIKVIMATGDNQKVAEFVSNQLGLDEFHSEVLPHEKLEIVKSLQAKGEFVAMIGDGVNDAPALAQADVSIAIGSGTDIAAETADILLVHSNPNDIHRLIDFGKRTYRKMVQNLVWAVAYNVLAIPLAAGVLSAVGLILSPAIGAVLMSLSTIVVALNAQLLRTAMK